MSPKIFTILLILLPTVLYYGFLDPLYHGTTGIVWTPENSIVALQTQNVGYQNALNQVTEVERGAVKLNNEYLTVSSSTIQKTAIMLPDDIDQLKLVNEVKAIANQSGIALSNVTVVEDAQYKSKDLVAYKVTFGLKARYPVFKKLMEEYEKNMRFYVTNSITIKRPVDGQTTTLLDKDALAMQVSFRVFHLKK